MEGSGVHCLISGECFVFITSKSCEAIVNVVLCKLPVMVVQLGENHWTLHSTLLVLCPADRFVAFKPPSSFIPATETVSVS